MTRFIILLMCGLCLVMMATAQTSSTDADIENRARSVGQSLRCVVCQNQSIDDSDAPLAGDMRVLVRAKLREGLSNQEVIDFMQHRYGDYVLLDPPVQPNTYILWFAPFMVLGAFLLWYGRYGRRRPARTDIPPLSDMEREKLAALTSENTGAPK